MLKLLALLVAISVAIVAGLFVNSTPTAIQFDPPVKVIGDGTPLTVHVENPHGVRSVRLELFQDDKTLSTPLADNKSRRFLIERHAAPQNFKTVVGRKSFPQLHDGKARIVITATGNDMRALSTTRTLEVDVMTQAPRVTADGEQHYINQGGSELVTFTPAGSWTEAGVKIGDYTFRGFPLPGKPGQYFSLFAFFWSLPPSTPISVYASNPGGMSARADFWNKIFPQKFRASTIRLEDMNLDRLVNQIDPNHKIPGELVQRFVYINNEMRKQNNKTLSDLRFQTEPKFLWTGSFLPMVDSTVESRFADDRTYTWQGKKVDEQTHLGFDLAKVQHAPVPASNDGKVLWAQDLGIYGNCIVIDHGFGLQTIYGHLSEFLVKKGDMVKRGQTIGKTGFTGLAGGDHLHFSMQVEGAQVNAVEWWDPHWVRDRILSKLGMTLPEEEQKRAQQMTTPTRAMKAKSRRRR